MQEITFYGMGGQGVVLASVILANAAFKEGKFVQAFPFYGIERRGASVSAYTRIDNIPIRARGQIYQPNFVVVLDPYLIGALDIAKGLRSNGLILLNTPKKPFDFKFNKSYKIATCDASAIAVKYGLGADTAPIVNTTMLGAFIKITGLVRLDSLTSVIKEKISARPSENVAAAREAYDKVIV